MDGYIVMRGKSYLTKSYFWYEHDDASMAYVFTAEGIKKILDYSSNWDLKPEKIIAARFEDGKAIIKGEL